MWSPSTRRAWIEIVTVKKPTTPLGVALHPEGVDRNSDIDNIIFDEFVALHPEGVDRNLARADKLRDKLVALHPEGVDRN